MNHSEKDIGIPPVEKNKKLTTTQPYLGDQLSWARVPIIPTVRFVPDKPSVKNIDPVDRSQSK